MRGERMARIWASLAVAAVSFVVCDGPPAAASGGDRHEAGKQVFAGSLDPVPFQAPTRPNVGADGRIEASLDDRTLRISGRFSGSPSPATGARLMQGLGIGVPGTPIGELAIDKAAAGSLSGSIVLTPVQVEVLRRGHLYVRIDTEKSPSGSAWGWLLPPGGEGE